MKKHRGAFRATPRCQSIARNERKRSSHVDTHTTNPPRRRPPTAAEINARQKREAEELLAKRKAAPPASNGNTIAPATAVTLPDNRTPEPEKYADEVAPSSIVGRLVKFNKDGVFVTSDDGEPIAEDREFFALVGDLQLGWIKFGAEGEPPTRIAGLLYHGFKLPKRAELGDDDPEQWPIGLSGAPTDPWLHQQNLVAAGLRRRTDVYIFDNVESRTHRRRQSRAPLQ